MRLLLCFLLVSCAFERRGTNPLTDDLYFPSGIVVPSGSHFAYVTNANFDLRYNSATLTTIDLDALDAVGPNNQTEVFNQEVIVSAWTKRIGNIASRPSVNPAGTQLFVASRERSLLFRFDIDPKTGEPSCGDESEPYDLYVSCDAAHTTRLTGQLFNSELSFADTADPYVGVVAPAAAGASRDFLFLTHLSAGAISTYDVTANAIDNPTGFKPLSLLGGDSMGQYVNGTSAVTVAAGPGRKSLVYAGSSANSTTTSRLSSALFFFEPQFAACPSAVCATSALHGSVALTSYFGFDLGSIDIKDMVASPDGDKLYMLTRNPDALMVMDISLDVDGLPRNAFVRTVSPAKTPNQLIYVPRAAGLHDILYVSSYGDNTLRAYDADTLVPLSKIDNIESGPFALAYARRPQDRTWVLVSYFNDDAVLVIDATNPDTTTHRVINRVGTFRKNK